MKNHRCAVFLGNLLPVEEFQVILQSWCTRDIEQKVLEMAHYLRREYTRQRYLLPAVRSGWLIHLFLWPYLTAGFLSFPLCQMERINMYQPQEAAVQVIGLHVCLPHTKHHIAGICCRLCWIIVQIFPSEFSCCTKKGHLEIRYWQEPRHRSCKLGVFWGVCFCSFTLIVCGCRERSLGYPSKTSGIIEASDGL